MMTQTHYPRPLAPLARRRRLVLMTVGGYALALAVALLYSATQPGNEWPFVVGSVLGLVVMAAGALPLYRPSRLGLPEGRDSHLDERQWQRLSQAHMTAYRMVGGFFLLACLYFYAAHQPDRHLPLPSTSYAWALIWVGAVSFLPLLPTLVLAWTEPDVSDE